MKRNSKKGFTVVELVIVIAIIAILAAVLIPTFASLIQKANVSKDTQLVKNLNTALAADNKEHKTMTEALAAAAEFGYDVGKINASATGNEILWDSENDVFCYLKGENVEYIPETSLKTGSKPADYKLWKIYGEKDTVPDTQKYSIYWNKTDANVPTLTVGFDAGTNSTITALTYKGVGTAQTVTLRTKGGVLTVNAPADTVYHYGSSEKVEILKVAENTYYENGESKVLIVKDGHVALSKDAVVDMFIVEATAKKITMDDTATIKSANIADNVDGKALVNAPTVNVTEVASVENLNKAVNVTTGNVYVKLTGNIDAGATSISVAPNGGNANITIDGDGHSITSTHARMIQTCADKSSTFYIGTLTISNVSMVNNCANPGDSKNSRGISLWKFGGELNLLGIKIAMPSGHDNYGVNLSGDEVAPNAKLNIKNTDITAYQCVNIYGKNREVNIENCAFISRNMHNSSYFGGCVTLFENASANIFISNTSMKVEVTEGYKVGGKFVSGSALGQPNSGTLEINNCTADGKAFSIDDVRRKTGDDAISVKINGVIIDLN